MESRLTYREKCRDVCWQKQLRDKYENEGIPNVPFLDVSKAIVRPISNKQAAQIIKKYEWLGTMGCGITNSYGIFFGMYCAGVTTFAPAGFGLPALAKTFKIDGSKLRYLARGANVHWAPVGSNSKLIAWSLKFEAKNGGKLAIAFADSDAGEIGTVYQASNWIYIGKGNSWKQFVSKNGKIWSYNSFTKWAKDNKLGRDGGIEKLEKNGWTIQDTNPKGRYVFILDRSDSELIKIVESMRQPYPKRPKQAMASNQEAQRRGSTYPDAPTKTISDEK